MKNKKKIIAILLLLMVALLGGASIFVAYRLNTQKSVAPTAPESRPRAGVSCATEGGSCSAGTACPTGKTVISGADGCATGELCCKGDWVPSNECKGYAFTISPPACDPRPACLDLPIPCKPAEPAGGWCPYLSCPEGKTMYKDVADNTPGAYNLDEANKLAAGSTLNPGQIFVYKVGFSSVGNTIQTSSKSVEQATIEDVLDKRLVFVDSVNECVNEGNKVICDIDKTLANANSKVAFRVKVRDDAAEGILPNVATISANYLDSTATKLATKASMSQCYGNMSIALAPTVKIACKKNSALNEAGTGIITSVGKSQTFNYSLEIVNNGNAPAPEVNITDTLAEGKLIFVESSTGCSFDETTKAVVCKISLNPGETKKLTIKVKTATTLTDGEIIPNTATATLAAAETGSECARDLPVAIPNLTAVKKAYRDNINNKAGEYHLTDPIDTVTKNQVFAYAIEVTNSGTGTASGININDPLTGAGQEQITFVDKDTKCEWALNEKLVKCTMDLQPGETSRIAFRTKVGDGVANGLIIKNDGRVSHQGQDVNVNKDLTVSTVVACNHTCTTDSECETGYVCETTAKKCRKPECTSSESCVCPATITEAPRYIPRPTAVVTERPVVIATERPTRAPVEVAQEEDLPKAGIFDIPGVAIFGGGLILAVVGILLAL